MARNLWSGNCFFILNRVWQLTAVQPNYERLRVSIGCLRRNVGFAHAFADVVALTRFGTESRSVDHFRESVTRIQTVRTTIPIGPPAQVAS
jgi:hypothetical protein